MLDFNVQDLGTSERLGPFRVEGFGACGLQLWGYTSWPVFQELDDKNGRGECPAYCSCPRRHMGPSKSHVCKNYTLPKSRRYPGLLAA